MFLQSMSPRVLAMCDGAQPLACRDTAVMKRPVDEMRRAIKIAANQTNTDRLRNLRDRLAAAGEYPITVRVIDAELRRRTKVARNVAGH
jgi:hypothetical protein